MKRASVQPPRETDRDPVLGTLPALGLFFLLALVYFAPLFLPGRGPYGTDYLAATYIFHDFIRDQQLQLLLPSWVPHVFGGVPLFANPGSTFHPVFLLGSLLLPTARVLGFIYLIQFTLAGFGMFLLARELRCRSWVSILAGLAYQFTGITASWVYAGHDGRIMVATMAPLLFYFLHRGIRTAALAPFAGGMATLALALLSFQIQNAYYLLLAAALWAVYLLIRFREGRSAGDHLRVVGLGLLVPAVAFGIAAVNFLPFLGYVPESPRGDPEGRGYEYSVSFSMPPSDLLATAVPEQSGASIYAVDPNTGRMTRPLFPAYTGPNPMKLHTEYLGALVLLLVLLGGWRRRNGDPTGWFFLGLGLFMLSLALGGHTPLYRLYYELLPGLKRFRAPDLAFYVTAFSLVIMAALSLERLASERASSNDAEQASRIRHFLLVWAPLLAVGLVGAGLVGSQELVPAGDPSRAAGWGRFALFVGLLGGALFLWIRRTLTTPLVFVLLAALTVGDLWIVGKRFLQTTPTTESLFVADDVAQFLLRQPQPVRVWNFPGAPHRGREDAYLMHFALDQAGGEHSSPMQRWNEYVGAGEGLVPRTWSNFLEYPAFLHAASVRYLLLEAELGEAWLQEVYRGRSGIVYENLNALPRAYLVPEVEVVPEGGGLARMQSHDWDPRRTAFVTPAEGVVIPAPGPLEGEAEILAYEADRVVVRTESSREALLVLADNMYPGWEARIGESALPVFRANHTLRGVIVPAGTHEVEFSFRPRALRIGLWLYLAGWGLLLAYGALLLVQRMQARRRAVPS